MSKQLDSLPPRVLRFHLHMDHYTNSYTNSIYHVPGKNRYTADTLSRAPLSTTEHDQDLEELAELLMDTHLQQLPASSEHLEIYRTAQQCDTICSKVRAYCLKGWPDRHKLTADLKPYWLTRGDLTIGENLLLYGGRVVVPKQLQDETVCKLHLGHQGIQRCRLRAQSDVWWPGISKQLNDFVSQCPECSRDAPPQKEPLITSILPDYPWQRIATDIFELDGAIYLVINDYFSRFPEVIKLKSTTSCSIIDSLKTLFARYGIPEVVRSNNGPQYSSAEFAEFATKYGFMHVTSSPYYPQSNSLAERTVKTVKKLLKEVKICAWPCWHTGRHPLLWCGRSPAELSQGRHVRTDIPLTKDKLTPRWPYLVDFRREDAKFKREQKKNFDKRHRTRPIPELPAGTEVCTTTNRQPTEGIAAPHPTAPISYTVSTSCRTVRRNRSQLNVIPQPNLQEKPTPPQDPPTQERALTRPPIQTRYRTGTPIVHPQHL